MSDAKVQVNFTQLRAAMLAAVHAGRVSLDRGRWSFKSYPSTPSQMVRAVKSLQFAGLVTIGEDGRAATTDEGRSQLVKWGGRL